MGVRFGGPADKASAKAVTLSSRNHGLFPAILSEISRYFCFFRASWCGIFL
jgi:hypothetical protein